MQKVLTIYIYDGLYKILAFAQYSYIFLLSDEGDTPDGQAHLLGGCAERRQGEVKYCSKCGNQLEDSETVCSKCGSVIVPSRKNNSPLGIIAFIVALFAGLLFGPEDYAAFGFSLEIIAIILAVLVLIMSKRRILKTGLPIAAICLSVLFSGLYFSTGTWSLKEIIPSFSSSVLNFGDKTKEALQNDVVTLSLDTISSMYQENEARFSENYNGRACIISGYISDISGDHAVFQSDTYVSINFVNEEDLASLNKGDSITIIGIIDSSNGFISLKNAYFL